MSNWIVVPNLLEGRDQLDERFPHREHGAEGTIGNKAHEGSASSHNPDESGKPEYSDHDSVNEVRAADFDKDLNDAGGVTMEQVVQLWLTYLRAGQMWWIRYLIYNGRIWHRRDNFVTHTYTGNDKHESHVHVTSDFTNAADTVRNTNWHLNDLVAGVPTTPVVSKQLNVDGQLGPKTIAKWQTIMGTPVDGVISHPSELVRAVQRHLRFTVDSGLKVDGEGINQDGRSTKTAFALQRYLKTLVDGRISSPRSLVIEALQRRLNEGRF